VPGAEPLEGVTETTEGGEPRGWRGRLRRDRGDAEPGEPAEGESRLSRKRRALIWFLIVLAALICFVGSFTVWVKRQLLDTDRWVETSTELLQDEQVQQALATTLTERLFAQGNVEARLENRFPSSLDPLAPQIAGFLEQQAYSVALRLLASPRTQALWEEINRRAHTALVALLKGEDVRRFSTAGGQVVLDVSPLLQQLADRLGVTTELPPDAGKIVIMSSDQLAGAQKLVRILNVISVFLALVVIALFALAIYLARGFRRQTLRAAGISLIVVGVLLLVLRRLAGDAVIDSLTSTATEKAGINTWLIASNLLQDQASLFIAYGIVAVVAAWVAGPSRWAVGIRRALAPTFRYRPALAYGVVFLLYLLVILWGPTGESRRLIAILILGALIAWGVEILRRQTLREFPAEEEAPPPAEGEPPPPPAPPPAVATGR
jgi:hypothetical protein